MLYGFFVRIGVGDDAPDVVQETFLKAWKNLKKFKPSKASFKTWLFTIGRNTATDFLRKKKPALFSDLEKYDESDDPYSDKIEDQSLLPDKLLEILEENNELNNHIQTLSLDYRTVLTLYYEDDLNIAEIGKVLKKPLNTVKSQHRRALIALRKKLENNR